MSSKHRMAGAMGALLWAGIASGQDYSIELEGDTPRHQFLEKHCVACHNSEESSAAALFAGLFFDEMDPTDVSAAPEKWEMVIRKVGTGMMPPASEPRPDPAEQQAFLNDLATDLDVLAAERPRPGRAALHRLNRNEYANAVRDLVALEVDPTALLPADDSSFGFDNIAGSLGISPVLLERYVAAAAQVSRLALGNPNIQSRLEKYTVPGDLTQNDHIEGLPFGTRGGMLIAHYFPVDAEYNLRADLVTRSGRLFGSNNARNEQLEVTLDGERIALIDLAEYDAETGASIRMFVPAGPHEIGAAFLRKNHAPVEDINRPFDFSLFEPAIDPDPNWTFRPHLSSISINGPFDIQGPGRTPSRDRILVCRPESAADEQPCAREIIETLATRAYRAPVNVEQLSTLMDFYAAGREGGGFERGIEMALRRILASPEFIFRFERVPEGVEPGEAYSISDVELASRLSFFLWSSIPDDELLEPAVRGRLRQSRVLDRQIDRMLADPRAAALTENFASQWLYLRNLDVKGGVVEVFPDFDDNLREAMRTETQMLFDSIVREDRSVTELLTADYTFVNERLARHYGMKGVYGSHFRRVDVPTEARRGLLGHGSLLMVTSYPNRTSPVQRGVWVLENVLGAPIPTPPPNVPELAEESGHAAAPKTLRERMELHNSRPFCAGCHKIMDPVGYALENFDAVGRWRTEEHGQPINASTQLVDGTVITGPNDLRERLLDYSDRFVQTMAEKLMTYALGRGLEYYDMPAVRAIVREAQADDWRFSALVRGIVASDAFQMREAEQAPESTEITASR